ncbi:hypothetical protein LCGC14_1124800 [marine sediment metagenome]|uniref:Uncharacterized protein n=1 Tax=marine sediment metagenome TaxID=412755 RepID=A0A0F9PKX7_9ZZZZ
MQFWTKLSTIIRHNQGIFISIGLCIPILLWFWGCESQVASLKDPSIKVNRLELNVEYETLIAGIDSDITRLKAITDIRLQDLHRQDEIKRTLYNHALGWAEGQPANPIGLLTTLGGIFGIGAVIDNRRKDGIIKTLKKSTG